MTFTVEPTSPTIEPPWRQPSQHIRITELIDPRVTHPVEPDSCYARRYWIPVIGPTAWCVGQRLADEVTANHGEVLYDVVELGRSFGLRGRTGRNARIVATLRRLEQFGLARWEHSALHLRRRWPLLSPRLVTQLPLSLQEDHALGRHPIDQTPEPLGEVRPGVWST